MRKIIFLSAFALGFFLAFVTVSNAQMEKEGTDSGTCIYTVTSRDCRKSPKATIIAIWHVMKSASYRHQFPTFRVFRQSPNMASLNKNRFAITFEFLGVYLSDIGQGPFHNMSTHSVGVIYFDKGVGKTLGWIAMTAPDGDKVLVEIKEDATRLPPRPNKGIGKFLGGTGKFDGILGTLEYSRNYTRPSKEGVAQAVAQMKFNWKAPEAKQQNNFNALKSKARSSLPCPSFLLVVSHFSPGLKGRTTIRYRAFGSDKDLIQHS